jgi:hypothetical protein
MKNIGKIKELELRDVWPHEAADSTPWLQVNSEELGEILGLKIVFIREQSAIL